MIDIVGRWAFYKRRLVLNETGCMKQRATIFPRDLNYFWGGLHHMAFQLSVVHVPNFSILQKHVCVLENEMGRPKTPLKNIPRDG